MGLQFGGIAVVLGGDRIFPALGMEMPQVLAQMREKKMGVVMGIWLLGNALQNQLSATGAFEVYFDGKQVPHPFSLVMKISTSPFACICFTPPALPRTDDQDSSCWAVPEACKIIARNLIAKKSQSSPISSAMHLL